MERPTSNNNSANPNAIGNNGNGNPEYQVDVVDPAIGGEYSQRYGAILLELTTARHERAVVRYSRYDPTEALEIGAHRRRDAASRRASRRFAVTMQLLHAIPNGMAINWDTVAAIFDAKADEIDKIDEERNKKAVARFQALEEHDEEADQRDVEEMIALDALINGSRALKTKRLEDMERRAKQQRESLAETNTTSGASVTLVASTGGAESMATKSSLSLDGSSTVRNRDGLKRPAEQILESDKKKRRKITKEDAGDTSNVAA